MTITRIRPIFDMDTRLRDIPLDWLRFIEPKVIRGSFLPCWIWAGRQDANGYAFLQDPFTKRQVIARRWIAKLFYDFDDTYVVITTCNNRACVNPNHLRVKPR